MSINFTARLMDSTTIPQRIGWRKHCDMPVSIVEIDRHNFEDMHALGTTSTTWTEKGAQFLGTMYENALHGYTYKDVMKDHFLALTTQTSDFEKLEPNKILGVMQFAETRNPENEILFLEVNPETCRTFNFIRQYKKVGTRIIDYVKSKYSEKDIYVRSARNAVKFYKKNGFKQLSRRPYDLCRLIFENRYK